ncbi:MAG TPA: hypothetical protein VKV24_02960 [Casimicrobiaceae bacterium]|nr:hypothetical protein [Casimicrobiaceae bacterium]
MPKFTAPEQALIDVWQAHTAAEFEQRNADLDNLPVLDADQAQRLLRSF